MPDKAGTGEDGDGSGATGDLFLGPTDDLNLRVLSFSVQWWAQPWGCNVTEQPPFSQLLDARSSLEVLVFGVSYKMSD